MANGNVQSMAKFIIYASVDVHAMPNSWLIYVLYLHDKVIIQSNGRKCGGGRCDAMNKSMGCWLHAYELSMMNWMDDAVMDGLCATAELDGSQNWMDHGWTGCWVAVYANYVPNNCDKTLGNVGREIGMSTYTNHVDSFSMWKYNVSLVTLGKGRP